jgi:hypothetical protein
MTTKRYRKSIQVDTVTYKPAGITASIYLDRNTLTFYADFMDQHFSSTTAEEVKTQVYQVMVRVADLVWQPVIEVEKLSPFHGGNAPFVGFVVDRFYVARRHDGTYAKVQWHRPIPMTGISSADDDDGQGNWLQWSETFYWTKDQGEFNPPTFFDRAGDRGRYYLPYTDPLWEGLQHLQQAIGELDDRLDGLLGTPEGLKALATIGRHLLLALPEPGEPAQEGE